jgi:hypothetical protein
MILHPYRRNPTINSFKFASTCCISRCVGGLLIANSSVAMGLVLLAVPGDGGGELGGGDFAGRGLQS